MKKNKIMLSVISGLLVAAVAVGGTLAYLSDKSNMVTNTFNVGAGYEEDDDGHVGLWLDEIDIDGKDEEGNPATRTEIGNEYEDLQPGSIVEKDPTFHLTAGSTDSYVFAQVTGVDEMIKAGYYFTVVEPEKLVDPAASAFNEKWVKVADNGVEGDAGFNGLYIYKDGVDGIVSGGEEMEAMFKWVKLGSDVDNEEFAAIAPSAVDIRGVAVQAANLTDKEAQVEAEKILATLPY